MAKKALVILAEGFEDAEAVIAVDVLRRAGVEVTVAGLAEGLVRGARGTLVQPDASLAEAAGRDHDALVLPGGAKGAENLGASAAVLDLVRAYWKGGKTVAAVCAAPAAVLAPAGVLEGRRVTGFPGTEGKFPPGAVAQAEPVVVDGNLITGRAMGSALAWSLAVAEKLAGRATADGIRRAVLFT
jgi:4-methyl-5(b-hydroxyethyl)-thiazole monophosphate biosynthesis